MLLAKIINITYINKSRKTLNSMPPSVLREGVIIILLERLKGVSRKKATVGNDIRPSREQTFQMSSFFINTLIKNS